MGINYEDVMSDLLGNGWRSKPAASAPKPAAEKGVPWEAKVIDGHYYVPLSQVADLLDANDVLPAVSKGIRRRANNPQKD